MTTLKKIDKRIDFYKKKKNKTYTNLLDYKIDWDSLMKIWDKKEKNKIFKINRKIKVKLIK